MNRRPFSFRSLAVAATGDKATAMSYRPHYIGVRPQIRRSYSGRPLRPVGDHLEFVSGDSHFSAVRDANRGFRPSYNAVPPPSHYGTCQWQGPPAEQQLHGPRLYNYHPRQVGPAFGNYQQFRPQQMPQQSRPRPTKPPDFREWEYRKPGVSPHCERFSILSYNILADYLATEHRPKLYFHIPRYMLDWEWRKRNIIFELGLWSADILCLQEVDRFQDIESELRPHGYDGIWKMRTGDRFDGCAIFWRVSRLKLLHAESIEYNKLGLRDNVAQICVFESLNGRNNSNGAPTLSTSSASSNRVVVCNIHVLFNTKRGDVKLGQIRVLLDKANAVSKLWDDAPIIICGDFNCTPKSPLYNFITGEKLDLSELARDKVSGQASAEIGSPRPAYPDFRSQAVDNSTQSFGVDCIKVEGDLPSDTQKSACLDAPTNAPSKGSCPSARHDTESPILTDGGKYDITVLDPSSEETHSESTEARENVESNLQPLSETPDNQIKRQCLSENHSNDPSKTSEPMGTCNSDTSQPSKESVPDSGCVASSVHETVDLSVSAAHGNDTEPSDVSVSCEATGVDDITLDIFEALSLDEVVDDKLTEDSESFLSELHGARQSSVPTDTEILNQNLEHGSLRDMRNWSYNPSVWTPAEIQITTGSADCNVMEQPLKLTSAYAEVESPSGLRDSSGEPFVTSYNRRFLGTVDYIWHTEGLQTVKVLGPIPKHVMQQTPGYPTRKWGSDHIALVSEFAFTKLIPSKSNQ